VVTSTGYLFLNEFFESLSKGDIYESSITFELKTEADGRMFPTTDSSDTIASCLTDTLTIALEISFYSKPPVEPP